MDKESKIKFPRGPEGELAKLEVLMKLCHDENLTEIYMKKKEELQKQVTREKETVTVS